MEARSDDELRALTGSWREQLDQIDDDDKKQEHLDDLLPEAFAAVREAGKRTLGQRHFDVQIMGGAALHFGWVAEMKTGEGKTLVATLPAYLNALSGERRPPRHGQRLPGQARRRVDGPDLPVPRARGRHRHPRDRRPRGEARRRTPPTSPTARTTSSASTTCATTWPSAADDQVQRGHHFAIVDEVDSILIDEARTPLIISGPRRRRAGALLPVRRRS